MRARKRDNKSMLNPSLHRLAESRATKIYVDRHFYMRISSVSVSRKLADAEARSRSRRGSEASRRARISRGRAASVTSETSEAFALRLSQRSSQPAKRPSRARASHRRPQPRSTSAQSVRPRPRGENPLHTSFRIPLRFSTIVAKRDEERSRSMCVRTIKLNKKKKKTHYTMNLRDTK